MMLKNNHSYNNDARAIIAELNVDISLLDLPNRMAQKFNTMKYDKFLNHNASNYSRKINNNSITSPFSIN